MTQADRERVVAALLLAPHGRDAEVAAQLLAEVGVQARACADLNDLVGQLSPEITFVVLADEATRRANLRPMADWLAAQPSWSDMPFIVLTSRGGGPELNPRAARLSEVLGNVTFVERPFHPTTFASLARAALRGRMRQYEARSRLEELRESEERLRTALSAGRFGSWELDLLDLSLDASDVCRANFGRTPDEPFTFADAFAQVHPEDAPLVRRAIAMGRRRGGDFAAEHRVVRPDGTVRWLEVRARVVPQHRAPRPRLVGVLRDVTDRKQAEMELLELTGMLEARVAERTAELEQAHAQVVDEMRQRELAEQQLRQAQKMEILGQLTGGVAHDFNNLLMAVLGNLDLLRRTAPEDARMQRLIDGALQGARRGAALTQRMLAFARQQALEVRPVDLGGLVRGLASLMERSVEHAVEIRVEIADGLPAVLADANQTELALLNLVVNARDAMPDGGTVIIRADATEPPADSDLPPGRYVRLAVIDEGTGMSPDTLSRAIEPFFSTKEVGKGTGLGLSMIHGLAVQMNGALALDSTLGHGTSATLWLPVAASVAGAADSETAERPPAPAPAPAVPAGAAGSPGEPASILLVEDDLLIAMSTVDMLQDLGHRVIEANSGAEALRLLESGEPVDLVITDFSMPKMTGVELAEAVRALRPDLPILLATGYASFPDGTEIDLPRLNKPYTQGQLAGEIAKLALGGAAPPDARSG